MKLFRPTDPGLDFILDHLTDRGARQYFESPEFASFLDSLPGKSDVVGAKEYYEITKAPMAECRLAVSIAKRLFA